MLASNDVKLKGEDRRLINRGDGNENVYPIDHDRRGIVFSLACNRILYI